MAVAHFIGGIAMLGLGFARGMVPDDQLFPVFTALMFIHCLAYVPTISVANSLVFANLKDGSKFGLVRLWGTIGWIAAGLPFIYLLTDWVKVDAAGMSLNAVFDSKNSKTGEDWLSGVRYVYVAAGVASLLLSVLSLSLPHTPPKVPLAGSSENATLKAISLLGKPFILVLFIVTLIDATVHQGYFIVIGDYLGSPREANGVGLPAGLIQAVTSIGQVAEILTMLVLAWFLKSFGWRITMIIGILGHAARFSVFAFFPEPTPAIIVNALHGICYAFFFATVYIFIDRHFPTDVRTSAQGLFNFLILGAGPFLGNYMWPLIKAKFTKDGVVNWSEYFLYPTGVALAGAVLLLLLFHPPKIHQTASGTPVVPH
jgi:hypothetical protein